MRYHFLLVCCECSLVKVFAGAETLTECIQGLVGEEIGIGVEMVVELVFLVAG